MAEIIDLQTRQVRDSDILHQDIGDNANQTSEDVLGLIGINPQSKGNNLATRLTARTIEENFQELHTWNMEMGNVTSNPNELFDDIDIAMLIIQKLEQFKDTIYMSLGKNERKKLLIDQAFILLAGKLGIKIEDSQKRKEKVITLYNTYRSRIQRKSEASPNNIRTQRAEDWNQRGQE